MQLLKGQPRALAQLQRALHARRLGHTWIFAGPVGVGKFTLALHLAKTKLCDNPRILPNNELGDDGTIPLLPPDFPLTLPCDVCESCRAVEAHAHPDIHIITRNLVRYYDATGKSKATNIAAVVIRAEITGGTSAGQEYEAKIARRSFRGRGKFFIIDEAELMDHVGQNLLLKTLEEPPPDSYIILVTPSPDDLLATIRSRSQLVRLSPLPDQPIIHALIGRGLSQEDSQLLTRLSHGSLGRALGWAMDMQRIREKQAAVAARKEKGGKKEKEEEEENKGLNPNGMIGWAKDLGRNVEAFTAGRIGGTELAAVFQSLAAEAAEVALMRDALASKDRAVRDALIHFLSLAADILSDRQRLVVGRPAVVLLPGAGTGLTPNLVQGLLSIAREAEMQIEQNAHVPLTLASTFTAWEQLVQGVATG